MVNPCNPPFPHPKKPPVSLLSVSKKKRGGEKKKVPLMGLTSRRFPLFHILRERTEGKKIFQSHFSAIASSPFPIRPAATEPGVGDPSFKPPHIPTPLHFVTAPAVHSDNPRDFSLEKCPSGKLILRRKIWRNAIWHETHLKILIFSDQKIGEFMIMSLWGTGESEPPQKKKQYHDLSLETPPSEYFFLGWDRPTERRGNSLIKMYVLLRENEVWRGGMKIPTLQKSTATLLWVVESSCIDDNRWNRKVIV